MDTEQRDSRWKNGDGYNSYISAELTSFRKDAWKRQILDHFAPDAVLDVLDIGCGPGFFSCILAEEGHNVLGIDSSKGMLEHARRNADALGVAPAFCLMDLDDITLEDDRFDLVVSRNVTWTLQHPERVYAELKRVLRPGGMLLIYDANWHMHFFDDDLLKKVRAREQRYFEKYGRREIVSKGDLEYYETTPLASTYRPAWDEKTLSDMGFQVAIAENIGEHLYEEWEKDLYAESPLFEVCAISPARDERESNMKTYWQERSKTFGFESDLGRLRAVGERIDRYLPEGRLKVLDIGCGPGTIACSMALLGHDVTAVDLSRNMVEKAKDNAAALGLDIEFVCTSALELPFSDDTFDAVVSRNLVWALPDPEASFAQWSRVLKPGGMVVYLDGNHYRYLFNDEDRRNRELVARELGTVHGSDGGRKIDYSLCDDTALDLPLSRYDRPREWDEVVLPKLGFDIVAEEISMPQTNLRYGEYDKGHYTSFLIAARNGKQV